MRPGPYKEVVSFLTVAKEADFKKYKKHMPEGLKWKKLTSVVMVETIRV